MSKKNIGFTKRSRKFKIVFCKILSQYIPLGLIIILLGIDICMHISDTVIKDDHIILVFVGILATFVVISNYAQVKDIENRFDAKIKEVDSSVKIKVSDMMEKILDAKKCVEYLYLPHGDADLENTNTYNEAVKRAEDGIENLKKTFYVGRSFFSEKISKCFEDITKELVDAFNGFKHGRIGNYARGTEKWSEMIENEEVTRKEVFDKKIPQIEQRLNTLIRLLCLM